VCGIAGQYNFGSGRPVEHATIRAMTRSLAHRGPDDEGYHFDGSLGLGFRRLSIIDLEGGHQPMSDADETVWVIFNGEIYNFRELRRELEGFGHTFRTRSDTEVILHGYRQWGQGIFNRLNGMFGLAIWDTSAQRLILARDSAGIKLVYYRVDSDSVLFGSEIRPILTAVSSPPGLNLVALNQFLRYRYTPSPLTLHEGIRKLAPGTMASFDRKGWRVERWHDVSGGQTRSPVKEDEAVEELLDIYKRALKRHLISDVPVGLLLSGGVDSGLLLALMSHYGEKWPTYSVGYGQAVYSDDELSDAARTARLYSASNDAVLLSKAEFQAALPLITTVLEEPIAASSIVPMYFVCQRARRDVKVALVGQGPDELFGGYKRHLGIRYGSHWRRTPGWLRGCAKAGIARLPRNETLKRGAHALSIPDREKRYQQVLSIMSGDVVDGLFRPGALSPAAGDAVWDSWGSLRPDIDNSDELGGFQILEVRSTLPDELLMYADKLSMAHGLEVRVPYLDREIVDFAARLPERLKIRFGQRKWLHRRVCEKFLPPEILNRKKRGFGVNVVDNWFHESIGGHLGAALLDDSSLLFDYLEPVAVRRLLEEHRAGRQDNHKILFSLTIFEEWLRAGHVQRRCRTNTS